MSSASIFAAPLLPIVWAAIASAIWWRSLSSPWLYLITAILALLGIQTVFSAILEYWSASSQFLEAATTPEAIAQRLEASNHRTLVCAGLVFVVSFPFLWWLKNGISASN